MEVTLISTTPNPIQALYVAYRVDYSEKTPQQILADIEANKITQDRMLNFCLEKLEVGHESPLEHITLEYAISGVTRAFSHQFVRYRHMSPEQQSQRYVAFKDMFPYEIGENLKKSVFYRQIVDLYRDITELYHEMLEAGIDPEDAREILPNATKTNLKVVFNFLELQHMADQRLCTRAQKEIRKCVSLMRMELKKTLPDLAQFINVKCHASRLGYCNESLKSWQQCPIGGLNLTNGRPHKSLLIPPQGTTQPQK